MRKNRVVALFVICTPIIILSLTSGSTLDDPSDNNVAKGVLPPEQLTEVENSTEIPIISSTAAIDYDKLCPTNAECSKYEADCITCNISNDCIYGKETPLKCTVHPSIKCVGDRSFMRTFDCKYCYLIDPSLYTCNHSTSCVVVTAPRATFIGECTVKSHVLCIGRRTFYKKLPCNWTSGYSWSMALGLSICCGGFGVDRFYLGLWKEGIGKLFSFGGLGVWTLVDVILIAAGYIGPYDGSLYI